MFRRRKILFLTANPREVDKLALAQEYKIVQKELSKTKYGLKINLEHIPEASIDDMIQRLNTNPVLLHFSGHGSVLEPGIFLQEGDAPQHIEGKALTKVLKYFNLPPSIVVLNSCYSSQLADQLCKDIDCVITMEEIIKDDNAASFSVTLYSALGDGCSIGEALRRWETVQEAKKLTAVSCRTRKGIDANKIFLIKPLQWPLILGLSLSLISVALWLYLDKHPDSEPLISPTVAAPPAQLTVAATVAVDNMYITCQNLIVLWACQSLPVNAPQRLWLCPPTPRTGCCLNANIPSWRNCSKPLEQCTGKFCTLEE